MSEINLRKVCRIWEGDFEEMKRLVDYEADIECEHFEDSRETALRMLL